MFLNTDYSELHKDRMKWHTMGHKALKRYNCSCHRCPKMKEVLRFRLKYRNGSRQIQASFCAMFVNKTKEEK